MFHATVSGLPDLKSFHEFTYKMWSSAQDDRFAMLFLRINAGKKSLTASFLADFVQNIIRGKEYILSACQTETDAFLVLVDLERLPLNQLHDRLKADFTGFLCYYDCVIYIGVSFATSRLSSIQEWEAMAKTACEAACMHGASSKVSLMFYRETLNTQHQEHRILPLFDSLLSHHHLVIYLQPKYRLGQSSPIGAEALVRILDTNGHLLNPASFLPTLAKYELDNQLDLMVMESVLKCLHTWDTSGMTPLPVSINMSSGNFINSDFMDIFLKVMDKYESVRHFLGFEIGAADFYSSANDMESMIHMLHDLGSSVSLDGLGGDTLLMSQLEIPPVDMVKFHRHFLLTGMKNANNRILFEKMAEIFNACNIPVLCEGIETSKEAHFVQECSISYMQGFYYGRPVPFDIFEKKYMIPQPAYLAFHAQ